MIHDARRTVDAKGLIGGARIWNGISVIDDA